MFWSVIYPRTDSGVRRTIASLAIPSSGSQYRVFHLLKAVSFGRTARPMAVPSPNRFMSPYWNMLPGCIRRLPPDRPEVLLLGGWLRRGCQICLCVRSRRGAGAGQRFNAAEDIGVKLGLVQHERVGRSGSPPPGYQPGFQCDAFRQQYAVPNYLTSRRINLRLRMEF